MDRFEQTTQSNSALQAKTRTRSRPEVQAVVKQMDYENGNWIWFPGRVGHVVLVRVLDIEIEGKVKLSEGQIIALRSPFFGCLSILVFLLFICT